MNIYSMMRETMRSKKFTPKESVARAISSLQHGGRAGAEELSEIADMSIVNLLGGGLTLEQAEMVLRMATIEIARLSEEARMLPKTPSVEIKIKNKGKR
jgi:hypothetical protein